MRTTIRKSLAVGAVASLAMFSAACGSEDEPTNTGDAEGSAATSEETTEGMDEETTEPTEEATEGMDPAANLVGSGCAAYAEANPSGAASVEGMAQEPVATAASGNPLLKTLVAAVTQADLVGALNDETATYTVFAPVDDAFAKVDAKTLGSLMEPSGKEMLTTILTYHVLAERIEPTDLAGTHTTLNNQELEVTGEGDNIMVNGQAAVICGGVQTANATVYLIDTVLMPKM